MPASSSSGTIRTLSTIAIALGVLAIVAIVGAARTSAAEPFKTAPARPGGLGFGFGGVPLCFQLYQRTPVPPTSDQNAPLRRTIYVAGFMDHDLAADRNPTKKSLTNTFDNAPCYYVRGHVKNFAGIAPAVRIVLTKLREIATAAELKAAEKRANANAPRPAGLFSALTGGAEADPADAWDAESNVPKPKPVLHGPFIFLLANNTDKTTIDILFYAPSHQRDGALQPNRNALAIGHRWVTRLLTGASYAVGDPLYTTTVGGPKNTALSHVRTCYGAPEVPERVDLCTTRATYVVCGCTGSRGCTPKAKYVSKNLSRATFNSIYVAYEVRLDHPDIAPLVTGGPKTLLRNALPYNTEMFARPSQTLHSENGRHVATLSGNSFRVNGKTILSAAPGNARSLMINLGSLRLETDQDASRDLTVAFSGSAPFTLVLENDGRLRVYDYSNRDVTDAELEAANRGVREPTPEQLRAIREAEDGEAAGPAAWGDWDPIADYRGRVDNLLNYLRIRNLLQNYDPARFAHLPAGAATAEDRIAYKRLTIAYGSYAQDTPYDPREDYEARLNRLVADLRRLGFTDAAVPTDPAELPKTDGATPPQYGTTAPISAAADAYDAEADYAARLTRAGLAPA